jgi:hypothetical protein
MTELEEKIFDLIEKTYVFIKIDKEKTIEKIWGIDDHLSEEERFNTYAFELRFDDFNSFGEYCDGLISLEKKFKNYVIRNIEDKSNHIELHSLFTRISLNFTQSYENFDFKELNGLPLLFQLAKVILSAKLYFEPRMVIEIENGYIHETDIEGIFKEISRFLDKKIDFIRQLNDWVNYYSVKIKPKSTVLQIRTLHFKESRIIDSKRLHLFRDKLIEYEFIDKIDLDHFADCFSGKEALQKINWKKSEVSFMYFFKQLLLKEIPDNKKTKWEELSNSFTLKSKAINPKQIETSFSKPCKTLNIRNNIDDCINQLKLNPQKQQK